MTRTAVVDVESHEEGFYTFFQLLLFFYKLFSHFFLRYFFSPKKKVPHLVGDVSHEVAGAAVVQFHDEGLGEAPVEPRSTVHRNTVRGQVELRTVGHRVRLSCVEEGKNQSEKGNQIPNFVWTNNIRKRFLCIYIHKCCIYIYIYNIFICGIARLGTLTSAVPRGWRLSA